MKSPIFPSKHSILHRLLKPPKKPTTHLRRLSAVPNPPPPPPSQKEEQLLTQSAISNLKSTDNWTNDTNLHHQLQSLPVNSFPKIARQLETSSKALQFFNFINGNKSLSSSLSPILLSSVFQSVIELAIREEDLGFVANLVDFSKELKVSLTPNSVTLLMRYFFRVKKIENAVLVFNELGPDEKSIDIKNTLLDLLMKSDRFEDAHHLLDEMLEPNVNFPPNEITLNIVLPGLLRSNLGNEDEKILGLVPRFGVHGLFPSNIWLTQLITKLCRSHRNDKAWDFLHELMKFGKVEVAPCNALLSGLGRARNFEKINIFLKEMKENDIKPDVVTLGMLVNHLCKFHRVDEALDMFKKMKEGIDGIRIKPDVILYNTLIDGLCKVGRQEEGFLLMEKMKLEDKCIPNVITYNCLIDGFCKSGEIERSLELFDQMNKEKVDPNVITINTLVAGMCKYGRIGNAMEFFRKMQEEKGIKGNVITYSTFISAFCGSNNIEKAMSLFEEMESVGRPDAISYYGLISGLAQAGRPDDASLIASKMKKAGFKLDLISYNTLIGGFCKRNKLDKAVEILKEMEESGMKADGITYNTLISHFSQKGDFETAHKFLKQMVNDGNTPTVVTYGTLIHAYCLAGNLDEAMNIFNEMLTTSKVHPNTVIYNILIDSLCKSGKVDRAFSMMDMMKQKGIKPNTTTYNAMLKGLNSVKRLKEALILMDQMTNQACHPDYVTMEILTNWLSAVGEVEKLKRFVEGYQVAYSDSAI